LGKINQQTDEGVKIYKITDLQNIIIENLNNEYFRLLSNSFQSKQNNKYVNGKIAEIVAKNGESNIHHLYNHVVENDLFKYGKMDDHRNLVYDMLADTNKTSYDELINLMRDDMIKEFKKQYDKLQNPKHILPILYDKKADNIQKWITDILFNTSKKFFIENVYITDLKLSFLSKYQDVLDKFTINFKQQIELTIKSQKIYQIYEKFNKTDATNQIYSIIESFFKSVLSKLNEKPVIWEIFETTLKDVYYKKYEK
jgi:predicted transcriptional regulator with HTH domain